MNKNVKDKKCEVLYDSSKGYGSDKIVYGEYVNIDGLTLLIKTTKQCGCYLNCLMIIKHQLDAMLSHYSKVSTCRVDLNFRDGDDGARGTGAATDFAQMVVRALKSEFSTEHVGYVWACESSGEKLHFHLIFMMDGNKTGLIHRDGNSRVKKIIQYAAEFYNLRSWLPEYCGKQVGCDASFLPEYLSVMYQCWYIAKERDKRRKHIGRNTNRFDSNHVPFSESALGSLFRDPSPEDGRRLGPIIYNGHNLQKKGLQYRRALYDVIDHKKHEAEKKEMILCKQRRKRLKAAQKKRESTFNL